MRSHSFPTSDFLKSSRHDIWNLFLFSPFISLSLSLFPSLSLRLLSPAFLFVLKIVVLERKTKNIVPPVCFHRTSRPSANRNVRIKITVRSIKLALISCGPCRRDRGGFGILNICFRLSAKRSIKTSMLGLESHGRQLNRKITHLSEPVPRVPMKRHTNANSPRNSPRNQLDYLRDDRVAPPPRSCRVLFFSRASVKGGRNRAAYAYEFFDVFPLISLSCVYLRPAAEA